MKLGLIAPGFSAGENDWCIPALLDLVRELARRHEVHVFALRYPHQWRTYTVHGATVHALGGACTSGVRRLPMLAQALAGALNEHRRRPFDALHGLWADEPGFVATAAGRLLGVPAVVSVLGGELIGLPDIGYGGQLCAANRRLARWALRRADCVTAGSAGLQRLAQQFVPAGAVRLMPLGVDARLFRPQPPPSGPGPLAAGTHKLLHVASLSPVKDQATLLRALARVAAQAPGAHLHVIGEGALRPSLERLAQVLGIADHVTFHGAVPHERLPAYYCAADLCVWSSRFESQGLAVLEAAACARAVAGTAVGVLPELAPAALPVPVGDDRALAQAILELLGNGARRADMGRAGRVHVQRRFGLEQTVPALLALYAQLRSHIRA